MMAMIAMITMMASRQLDRIGDAWERTRRGQRPNQAITVKSCI